MFNFITKGDMNAKDRYKALEVQTLQNHTSDLLLLRGLFTYDLLDHVLMKRWNVDYGVREGGPGK